MRSKKFVGKDNIIWTIRALCYGYVSAIRFADSSFSSRSCLLLVREIKTTVVTRRASGRGWSGVRIVEKFVKKKP